MIGRKLEEILSDIYRGAFYPFVRLFIEIKTKSILKQKTYLNKGSVLLGRNYLGRNVYLTNTELGYGSYIAEGGRLIDTRVGKYCSIGADVSCAFGIHPLNYVSTCPSFYSKKSPNGLCFCEKASFDEEKYIDEKKHIRVMIGNDVWIGARVTLLEGIKIGDGAVIAAGAVVNCDVEPYSIYGGVPAKKIGDRFDEDTKSRLLNKPYWEMSESCLKEKCSLFSDIDKYLDEV